MMNTALNKTGNKLSIAAFTVTFLLVMLNIFTPLRLNTDGIRYLNILEYFKGSFTADSPAASDYLPHGYSWFLYLADKLHLMCPMFITLVNILSVLGACYLLATLLKIEHKLLYFVLVLISFINIKHYTLAVSDQLFTLIFFGSIFFWARFFDRAVYAIIPAIVLTLASVYLRTAGVSSILGVILYWFYKQKASLARNKAIAISTGMAFLACLVGFFINLPALEKKVNYLQQLKLEQLIKNPFSVVDRCLIHIKEIGETTINMPYSKLSSLINIRGFDVAQVVLIVAGLVACYVFYRVAKYLKLYKQLIFWVALSYLLIIFVWPFYDTRFLIPLLPVFIYLLFYHLFLSVRSPFIKFIPLLVYVLFGLISLVYSDSISLNKPFFLTHYGIDPVLTKQYEVHFANKKLSAAAKPVYNINRDDIPYLLEKYDRSPFISADTHDATR